MTELPPGVRITGGCGGTVAVLEDLERIAGCLRVVADRLDEGYRATIRLTATIDETWRSSPLTASAADSALAPYRSLGAVTQRATDLRTAVRAARSQYEQTDLGVATALRSASVTGGYVIGEGGPAVWFGAGALAVGGAISALQSLVVLRMMRGSPTPVGLALGSLALLRGRPGLLGGVGGALSGPGLLPDWHLDGHVAEAVVPGMAAFALGALPGRAIPLRDPVPAAAGTFADVDEAVTRLAGGPTSVVVSRVPGTIVGPPPRTAADALELVDEQYPDQGGLPGSIAVQQLVHADGSRSWVVAIPGTQEVVPGGSNPTDMRTNFRLVAGQPDDMSRVVDQAMRAAGIRPGEPVLVVGHSQGGLVAARVVADPAIRERYDVTAVLTAGSPIGGIDLPAGLEVMSLEHTQDAVPALDGRPNPDTPYRTTVERDLSVSVDPRDRAAATPLAAHPLSVYERTARGLESSDDPSVQGFAAAIGEVLGGAVAARTTIFQGVRVSP